LETLALKDAVIALTPPSPLEQVQFLEEHLGIESGSAKYIVHALGVMGQEAGGMFWVLRAVRELVVAEAFTPAPRGVTLEGRFLKRGRLPAPAAMRARLAETMKASGKFRPVVECAALMGEKFRVDDLAECLGLDRLNLLQIL